MSEGNNYNVMIPSNVRYDSRLTPMAKLLYGEIDALAYKDGICWASNDYLAKLYNMHKKSISRNINELVAAGYITIELTYKPGTKEVDKRIIKLSTPINENVNTYPQNCGEGINENVNTYPQNCGEGINKNVPYPIHKIVEENTINSNTINSNTIKEEGAAVLDSVDKYYEDNIGKLSNSVIKELGEWLTKVDDSLIKYAIDEAVKYNKKRWNYIRAVLRGNYSAGRRYGPDKIDGLEDEPKKPPTETKKTISQEAIKRLSELGA